MRLRHEHPDPADPEIIAAARRAIADRQSARDGAVRRHQQHARDRAAAPRGRPPRAGVLRAPRIHRAAAEARVTEARARADAAAVEGIPRQPRAARAVLGVGGAVQSDSRRPRAHPTDRLSVHLGETPEEVELLTRGTGEIRDVLRELGRWPEDVACSGRRARRVSRRTSGCSTRACSPCTACSSSTADLAELAGAGNDDRLVPAQQRARRRRLAAAGRVLRLGRAGRVRHRQPGQRRRPQSVRGTAQRPAASPPAFRRGNCSRAPRASAPTRWVSRRGVRHDRAGKARRAHRRHAAGRRQPMWKNTWCL